MKKYDYLIVGAGLYGSAFAREVKRAGKRCLVIEKRGHIAGNAYTKEIDKIQVHCYGPHIFHTNDSAIWNYVNQFAKFNRYTNSPVAYYQGKLYNLPFNMNTFYQMWGVTTPAEAQKIIEEQRKQYSITNPRNLEEQAIRLVGPDIYEKLIRGYTEKQWGVPCSKLPPTIINRLPIRFSFDNNYFDAQYQGIPIGGYTKLVERMLEGVEVQLGVDFLKEREKWKKCASRIVYTGPIDAYFNYKLGALRYRSLKFETVSLDCANYQGNAVINYTDAEIPYTRIIEHKHFEYGTQLKSVISKEYSLEWDRDQEPFYPVNDEKNDQLYGRYKILAAEEKDVLFGGRLGEYKYYDMDMVISQALSRAKELLE